MTDKSYNKELKSQIMKVDDDPIKKNEKKVLF